MRSTLKFGVPLAVAALALAPVAPRAATPPPGGGGSAAKPATCKIGFFGALTGAERQPRHLHPERRQARPRPVQREARRLQGHARALRLAGRPDPGPGLAKKAIDDKNVVGIVGPAFSGESKAADPLFNEAGLVDDHRRRRPTRRWPTTAGRPSSASSATTPSQGPAAAKYIKDTLKAKKVVRHRRRVRVRQGPGRHRPQDLGRPVVGNDTIQQKQTDFSPPRSPRSSASGADALFFGGYYAEAAPLIKQLRDAGWKGTFVVGRRRQGPRLHRGRRRRPPRARSSPARACPPDKAAGTFHAAYKKAYNADPDTYSARGLRLRHDPARRHRRRQGPRRAWSTSSSPTTSRASRSS